MLAWGVRITYKRLYIEAIAAASIFESVDIGNEQSVGVDSQYPGERGQ